MYLFFFFFFFRIPRFQGQAEFALSGEAILTSMTHKRVWSRPPISMDFQVLMFTSSGLLVRFLKVFEKSGYQSVKWVRYMTKAGSYQIRVSLEILRVMIFCTNYILQF
jgi:AP-2 complex subunit mu-1